MRPSLSTHYIEVLLVAALCFSAGCKNPVKDAVSEAAEIRKQIDASTKAFERTLDRVALAVPGERYLRLIDAAHSTDPGTRQAAQADIKRLFGVEDMERKYVARVEFLSADGGIIHADAFSGPIASSEWVKESCLAAACNDRTVNIVKTRILSRDERQARLATTIESELGNLVGRETLESGCNREPDKMIVLRDSGLIAGGMAMQCHWTGDTLTSWSYRAADTFEGGKDGANRSIAAARDKRRKFAEALAHSLLDVQSELRLDPAGGAHLEVEWNLISPSQVLFVIIREADFRAHYESWKEQYAREERPIRARLHDAGDVSKLLNQRADYAFDPDEFRNNPVVELQNPRRRFVWAAHNMTGAPSLSSEELQRHRDILARWAEVTAEEAK